MIRPHGARMEPAEFVFTGAVVSGRGEGRHFTQLDWVREQFRALLGFEPYPGTFNLRIDTGGEALLEALKRRAGIQILPPNADFCAARCFAARIGSLDGALVIPLVPGYPSNVLELIAPVNVRATLGLDDGAVVTVSITA